MDSEQTKDLEQFVETRSSGSTQELSNLLEDTIRIVRSDMGTLAVKPVIDVPLYEPIIIASVVIGVILVYFLISLIRHQRRHLKLTYEKIQAEVETLENERKRIAADLHDEVGPTLSGIKLMLSSFEPKDGKETELLQKVNKYIDNSIRRMREISNNLMPKVLEKRGIVEALQQYFNETMKIYSFEIEFIHDDFIDLKKDEKLHLYRILQEITHNTVKHAKCTLLKVWLKQDPKFILLRTSDNGVGFSLKEKQRKYTGLGLMNLRSRAQILDAELTINATPDKGTDILLKIPRL